MTLHEPDVAITDFILALECFIFAFYFFRQKVVVSTSIRNLGIWLFFLFSLSSLFGGLSHGLFQDKNANLVSKALWVSTVASIGAAGCIFWLLIFELWPLSGTTKKRAEQVVAAGFFLFVCALLLVTSRFYMAILFYLPPTLVLALVFYRNQGLRKDQAAKCAWASIGLSLFASSLQQLKVALHPIYFNHNALYHLIQAISLALMFFTLRRIAKVPGIRYKSWSIND